MSDSLCLADAQVPGADASTNLRFPLGTQPESSMARSAKELLKQAVDNLPADATVEEAMERLLFLAKIERRIAQADAGRTMSHEEVGKRLGL